MVLRINVKNRRILKIEYINMGETLFKLLTILADEEWHSVTELCQRVYGVKNPSKKDKQAIRLLVSHLKEKHIEVANLRSKGYKIGLHTLID